MELLYEGKAKRIYRTERQGKLLVSYKDAATAFNGEKKTEITGKGRLNNEISVLIFEKLKEAGIANHLIRKVSETEQLVEEVTIIPLEVVVRNIVAGSMAKRLGIQEGTPIPEPIVEFYYKDDALGDPLITESHIALLNAATPEQTAELKEKALKVNQILIPYFAQRNVRLIDFKLEFGLRKDGTILLADEISPDTCRLWDAETGERLDKDVFRRDLGSLTNAYEEILKRLGGPAHV
ncbi:phosphoribosylaminoimidazolesuccinocarboxamide synthase [Bacillus mangrovi]|uniref:Phosphoribosylaminoimidazole-succinocarboxamide synthase n=1 Tax=Metabacillus mangrovi TaxID=1491830 RepID=A0A7X2S5T8_9BACI|nr:phosphoribosylaminoimidazolesuccinocarboxamide synthase [Metabacillus mangrovi]MTH54184.1 phosphoribosylaminoimidazolesuccinocarboxamide synthase [Metabacillus mangrovi]